MTYEQAIAICRNPARSVRDAKAVLRWAVSEPAPDKVWFLLLLATNAFAAHKGFNPSSMQRSWSASGRMPPVFGIAWRGIGNTVGSSAPCCSC